MQAENWVLGEKDNWVLGYVIEFSDGGEPEVQILHKGTKESCEKLAAALPAVYYNGDRPDPKALLRWIPFTSGIGFQLAYSD
jgi:1-acyl-sn-glycerol-3-phosphate acyltransferase